MMCNIFGEPFEAFLWCFSSGFVQFRVRKDLFKKENNEAAGLSVFYFSKFAIVEIDLGEIICGDHLICDPVEYTLPRLAEYAYNYLPRVSKERKRNSRGMADDVPSLEPRRKKEAEANGPKSRDEDKVK